MEAAVWQVLVNLLGVFPVLLMAALVLWKRRRMDADERRGPLTTELCRLPGASLQQSREELLERQTERLLKALAIGLVATQTIVNRRVTPDFSTWNFLDSLILLVVLGTGAYYGWLIVRDMPASRRLRQAIEAEQATAQEISSSLAGENRIFHDIQAKGFNIDHVVITSSGVFAIETKSRLKPPVGQGKDAVRVRYDGKLLQFPGWQETEALEQASRQAKWLAGYLKKATGEAYPVTPVLALPGWFVDQTVRPSEGMVRVVNPKAVRSLFFPGRAPRLDARAIQVAAFQIEKLAQVEARSA
jgi:hypothetical protein